MPLRARLLSDGMSMQSVATAMSARVHGHSRIIGRGSLINTASARRQASEAVGQQRTRVRERVFE
eukprot:2366343-Pleurochrysis_carterae.AAC.1